MKILHLSHTGQVSGAEHSLLTLMSCLPREVVAGLACPPGELAERAVAAGIAVHRLPAFDVSLRLSPTVTSRAALSLLEGAGMLRRIARQTGATIVHANSTRAALIATLAELIGAPPFVTHVRDVLPSGVLPLHARRLTRRRALRVIALSRYVADRFADGNPNGASIAVIDNPVDLERFEFRPGAREALRGELGVAPSAPLLGIVGQITSWKGHDTAIKALAQLPPDLSDACLVVVGEVRFATAATRLDNRAFRKQLDDLICAARLEHRVVFLGQRDDIPALISGLDALLVPSVEEPFGRTVAEAMAIGVPVIATTVGGPAELIEPGVTGLLAPPREPGKWADAIASVLRDREAAHARVERARDRARERFDSQLHADRMLDVFAAATNDYRALQREHPSGVDAKAGVMNGPSMTLDPHRVESHPHRSRGVRVVYVNHTSVVAGAEQALLEHLRALDSGFDSPTVVCPPGEFADELEREGRAVIRFRGLAISFRITPRSLARGVVDLTGSALVLRRVAARTDADVIHANSIRAGLIAACARLLGGPPFIVHVHDVLPEGLISRLVRRLLIRHSAALVAISSFARDAFLQGTSKAAVAFPVINTALDVERLLAGAVAPREARKRVDLPGDAPVLGIVGQITPWKGHDTAISAMPEVLAAHPDAKLVIVGEARFVDASTRYDNRAYERSLRSLVAELDIGHAVRFLGQRDDIPVVMRALDLLLLPSTVEPLGRVALEAMVLSTPILATDVGGLPEIIVEGQSGFLAPPGDVQTWTRRILELLGDRARLTETGERGRAALVNQLAHATYADEMSALYEEAARQPQPWWNRAWRSSGSKRSRRERSA